MFTWNFKYVSKSRLAENFTQLALNSQKGDILVRIHTALHNEDEAVELARFVKTQLPGAHIFGTSTSAIIGGGRLRPNQCVISLSQMSHAHVRSAMIPSFDDTTGEPVPAQELCRRVKDAVIDDDSKLMLTFLTKKYLDVYRFVEDCNDCFPGMQMIGGVANTPEVSTAKQGTDSFVFDENGWSDKAVIVAALGGGEFECLSSYATGALAIGDEIEVTDAFGPCILSVDGRDAAAEFRAGVGDALLTKPELAKLFPYVYSEASDIPVEVKFAEEMSISEAFPKSDSAYAPEYRKRPDVDEKRETELIRANHCVEIGKKLRRAFIYDRKIIADNRAMFRKIEKFEKAETLFAYSCTSRSRLYSNCVKWELSAYENSTLCGCLTAGEIACADGRNHFANCSFVASVMGEENASPLYNPFVFTHTDALVADNRELLDYLMEVERALEKDETRAKAADGMRAFVRDCELKLLYSRSGEIPNAAAMNMDMKLKGFDRVCIINVTNVSGMRLVFTEQAIELTHKDFIAKCVSFAEKKHYRLYSMSDWQLAVAATSYLVTLSAFSEDMEELQRELFRTSEGYVAIVPFFCVLDDCTVDNLQEAYNAARVEMAQKNNQFYVRNAQIGQLDEEGIRRRYHMVNVINYAITHDKVIPYFQGIYDNAENKIHHYESLMRLEDENGKLYYPEEFLEVARSFGLLYDTISKIMIRKVFAKFKNYEDKSVSINLGIRDIKNREIVEYIYDFLPSVKHPENFVFEILENEDVDEYEYLLRFVEKIHGLGGRISIDDFGSGYSNLQHVVSIPSDYLKIDGSIIKKCCEDQESENLLALISGFKNLSSRSVGIIAEYVENEEIQNKLKSYGIDYSQGFLFSKPSPNIAED